MVTDTKNTGNAKAATRAKNKYNAENYDRLYPLVKKGEKEKIENAAKADDKSLNEYIVAAIYEKMERGVKGEE